MERTDQRFRHLALLYAGPAEFVAETCRFVREGLDADEAVLRFGIDDP